MNKPTTLPTTGGTMPTTLEIVSHYRITAYTTIVVTDENTGRVWTITADGIAYGSADLPSDVLEAAMDYAGR